MNSFFATKSPSPVYPLIEAGKVKVLALTGKDRPPFLLPRLANYGLKLVAPVIDHDGNF
jgi:tripartite-type tricarboxylate transporter receptor subunit TctC